MSLLTRSGADVFAPTTSGGAARGADMGEAQIWSMEVERLVLMAAASGGARIYADTSAMNADLTPPANAMAWVATDPITVYRKAAPPGSGPWVYSGVSVDPTTIAEKADLTTVVALVNAEAEARASAISTEITNRNDAITAAVSDEATLRENGDADEAAARAAELLARIGVGSIYIDTDGRVTLSGIIDQGLPDDAEDVQLFPGWSMEGEDDEVFGHVDPETGVWGSYGFRDLEDNLEIGSEDAPRFRAATLTLDGRDLSSYDPITGAIRVHGIEDASAEEVPGAEDKKRYAWALETPLGTMIRLDHEVADLDIDLLETGPPGETVTNNTYAVDVVTDVDGRSQLVSYHLGSGQRRTLTSLGDNVEPRIDSSNRVLFRRRLVGSTSWTKQWIAADGSVEGPFAPAGTQIWCWGDSLTQGAGGTPWPTQADALLSGYTFPNRGIGGQTSPQIAARMAPLAGLTVSGDQIPASGSVNVTALTINLLYTPTATARTQTGNLAGVPGTLSKSSGGAYTFTRTTAGSVVACPPGTIWVSDDGVTTQTAQGAIIWVGRNDIFSGGADIEASIASMVAYLRTYVRHVLIIGVTDEGGGGEAAGTTNHTLIVNTNAASAAAYGDAFLDIRRYLIDHGLADAGITPTAQDLLDIADDNIPESLRAGSGDLLHLNTAGYGVVAARVVNHINTRGWLL